MNKEPRLQEKEPSEQEEEPKEPEPPVEGLKVKGHSGAPKEKKREP